MEVKAQHKHVRMSPRKVRLIREVVVGLPAVQAEAQLQYLPGKAAKVVHKVLRSAMANAQHNYEMERESLIVKDVVVDASFTLKRFMPVSKGMAHEILKRNSHVTVVVTDGGVEVKQGKKSEIDTLDLKENASLAEGEKQEKEGKAAGKESKPQTAKPVASESEKVFQKKKMQQMGGDRRKSVRRKSPGDAK